jgi:hypothetical protein
MKILGYILIIAGLGILVSTGSPSRWEKGTYLKKILIRCMRRACGIGGAVAAGEIAIVHIQRQEDER